MFLGVFGDGGKKHPKKIGNGPFEVRFAIGNGSFLPRLCQK